MITAQTIIKCANLSSIHLESLLEDQHPNSVIVSSQFLGISNGQEFVYDITLSENQDGEAHLSRTKMFVSLNYRGDLVGDAMRAY